jgi:hypothetical protein
MEDRAEPQDLAALWQDFIDGALDAGAAAELERQLAADPGIAAGWADRYVEHRLLALALSAEQDGRFTDAALARIADERQAFSARVRQRLTPGAPLAAPSARRTRPWPQIATAAMVALALCALWLAGAPSPAALPVALATAPAAVQVATLVLTDHAQWAGTAPASGERLVGGVLELVSGRALVRFGGGAELLLQGPAGVRLESGGSASCLHGSVGVRAERLSAGFILRTPVAEITDLGTEFAVTVTPAGVTEMEVLEGAVAWRGLARVEGSPGTLLHQGERRRLHSSDDQLGEALPPVAARIDAQLAGARADGSAADELISYDGFDYPFATTTSRQHAASGGRGWRSHWYRNKPDSDLAIAFTPGEGLALPAGLAPGLGGRMELPVEPERPDTYRIACMRLFDRPFNLASDSRRYLSLVVQRSPEVAGPTHHWFRCMLTSESVPADRLGFGIQSSGCPELLGRFGNRGAQEAIEPGRPYLFVLKVSAARDAQAQSFLKVYALDDAVDAHEPAAWTVVGQPGRFTGVLGSLHINNGTERAYAVDEVRIGTTWESVTPRR